MQSKDIKKDSLKAWILAARPKTLSGAAVPVMIGLALAYKDSFLYEGDPFCWVPAVLCLLFAWVMQIDANFINDFFDFTKGTDDTATRLGPRRACAQGWVSVDKMKHAIALTTCIACLTGLPLVLYGGLEMVLVGILCLLFCFLYTTYLSYIGMGDMLVVLFFGIVPVCVPYYIQLHICSSFVFLVSVACGMVVDTLDCQQLPRPRHRQSRRQNHPGGQNRREGIVATLSCPWLGSLHNGTGIYDQRLLPCLCPAISVSRVPSLHVYAHQAYQPRQGPQPLSW